MSRWPVLLILALLLPSAVLAEDFALDPYVDRSQLDVPWPNHSHYKQPWRAFLETRSAEAFLRGVGVNFNVQDNLDVAARLLAEAGFGAARIEIGWGNVNWDETGFNGEERLVERLEACRRHGLRPTILLNAHHGVPCPVRFFERRLAADAAEGDRTVRLDSTDDIVPGRTGLSNLTTYMAAEAFITEVDAETGECQLSQPLPKALDTGSTVLLAKLKYLPAHPVGTPEFEEMAQGWERYVSLVLGLMGRVGIDDFDIEIWNELSFGSDFMGGPGINRYYEPDKVRIDADFLNPGGHAWEIGRRTVELVDRLSPGTRCIWGFSNTTFFHTPITRLPAGVDGQSYHPYGTGTREMPAREQAPDAPDRCLEGFVPVVAMRMPEGWAQTFVQTESLMRLLNPEARQARPEGSEEFAHYMTEHGVVPGECGIETVAAAWDLKARCALRSFLFWLNKGVDAMHYYCAHDANPLGMGLLPAELGDVSAEAAFDDVATPPLQAMKRLTRAFDGAEALAECDQIGVEAVALAAGRKAFEGDGDHPPLWERDLLAVLPFQLDTESFAVALCVMTYDYTDRMPDLPYRLTLRGLPDGAAATSLYDPLRGEHVPFEVLDSRGGALSVRLALSDSPRVLKVVAEP